MKMARGFWTIFSRTSQNTEQLSVYSSLHFDRDLGQKFVPLAASLWFRHPASGSIMMNRRWSWATISQTSNVDGGAQCALSLMIPLQPTSINSFRVEHALRSCRGRTSRSEEQAVHSAKSGRNPLRTKEVTCYISASICLGSE